MLSATVPGMEEEGVADTLSGPAAGGTGRTSFDEDAGPRALRGAKEGGLQEGQEDPEWPPLSRGFRRQIRRLQRCSFRRQRGGGRGGRASL